MAIYQDIQARQLWAEPAHVVPHCQGYRLPFPGTVTFNDSITITLSSDAVYETACAAAASASATSVPNSTLLIYGLAEPFEASVVPQMFVLGAMLVIAWSLVVILMITPRTSFVLGTGIGHLGRAGGNSATVITVGGRPWLQKFAALTVGISLFIATVNSFKIVQQQYNDGYEDAAVVTTGVVNSVEVRVMRVISTTFVWLAQVQTLIRLFPRHQEKVIIKWAGFGLIILDTLFVILNSFLYNGSGSHANRPRLYGEVIPILTYLFEVALNVLYAAWVVYYSLVKRRFAFFHPQMRNIAIVALLSYVSVLIPVVFFALDVAKPQLASWGDYIRWVGSAAASVVVWEWVERIEALEREERKNGILGREIFDGDDNIGKSSSLELKWPRSRAWKVKSKRPFRHSRDPKNSDDSSGGTHSTSTGDSGSPTIQLSNLGSTEAETVTAGSSNTQPLRSLLHAFRPQANGSPVSRADTASAASTVYAVIHHPPSASTTPAQDQAETTGTSIQREQRKPEAHRTNTPPIPQNDTSGSQARPSHILPAIGNPFKRRRSSPPPEVSRATGDAPDRASQTRWPAIRRPKPSFHLRRPQPSSADLPVVVIPAQPRGRIWTPPIENANENPLENANQEPVPNERRVNSSPLSQSQSAQDIRDATPQSSRSLPARDDQPSPSRGSNSLTPTRSMTSHASDRAQSPRILLPRVDENTEHSAPWPNGEDNGENLGLAPHTFTPPGG